MDINNICDIKSIYGTNFAVKMWNYFDVFYIVQVTSAVFNQLDENLSDAEDQSDMNMREEGSDENEQDENEHSTTKVYLQLI